MNEYKSSRENSDKSLISDQATFILAVIAVLIFCYFCRCKIAPKLV